MSAAAGRRLGAARALALSFVAMLAAILLAATALAAGARAWTWVQLGASALGVVVAVGSWSFCRGVAERGSSRSFSPSSGQRGSGGRSGHEPRPSAPVLS